MTTAQCRSALLLVDLIANNTADRRTTYGPDRTTTGQYRSGYSTNTGADSRVFVLRRHSGTTTESEYYRCSYYAFRKLLDCFHFHTFLIIYRLQGKNR